MEWNKTSRKFHTCLEFIQVCFSNSPICLHSPLSLSLSSKSLIIQYKKCLTEGKAKGATKAYKRGLLPVLGNQKQWHGGITWPFIWDPKIINAKNVHKTLKFHLCPKVIMDLEGIKLKAWCWQNGACSQEKLTNVLFFISVLLMTASYSSRVK